MATETLYARTSDYRSLLTGQAVAAPAQARRLVVGARCLDYTSGRTLQQEFAVGTSTFGNLGATRAFAQDATSPHEYVSPVGVDEIVSYKDTAANPSAFVNSLRGTEPWLTFYHEPEGPLDFPDGPTFVSTWTAQRDKVKAIRPGVKYGMIAGGFQYRNKNKRGWTGSFIPPDADWYGFDSYRTNDGTNFGALTTLANTPEFQRWLSFVGNRGKPLVMSEYGRGLIGTDPVKRNEILAADYEWMKANGFSHWIFWWSNRDAAANQQWRFSDASTISAWSSIVTAQNGA